MHLLMVLGDEDSLDSDHGLLDLNSLQMAAKKLLKTVTPSLMQNTFIDDEKLITKVYETNRRGQNRMIQKVVCPFCFTLVAPQIRPRTGIWDMSNFKRHLIKTHSVKTAKKPKVKLN